MAKYTTYTKERLADALFDLIEVKPIEEVSISELAERAQVNRASFYRNFRSKEEVLLHRFASRYRAWEAANEELTSLEGDPYVQTREFFQFMLDERELMMTFHRTNTLGILLEFLDNLIGPTDDDRPEDAFYRSYHAYGVFGVYSKWIERGMQQSPEEMAALIVYQMHAPHESLIRAR